MNIAKMSQCQNQLAPRTPQDGNFKPEGPASPVPVPNTKQTNVKVSEDVTGVLSWNPIAIYVTGSTKPKKEDKNPQVGEKSISQA